MPANLRGADQFLLGAISYAIRWATSLDSRGDVGTACPDRGFVRVEHSLPAIEADTLLHEATHTIIHHAGIDFPKDDDEEDFVTKFTPWLHAFIVQNPALIRKILKIHAEQQAGA